MLRIVLQDGFEDDTVVIAVDGEEVFRQGGVTTRTQLSLADSIEVEPDNDPATVEVRLPDRNLEQVVEVDLGTVRFLGITLNPDGKFALRKLWDVPGFV